MEIIKTFYLCALQGHFNLLKELKKFHLIDINISDKDGTTALILASANNQLEMVKELLKMGANPNLVRQSGTGPLFFACQLGYTSVTELLLRHGAYVNQRNKRDDGTPLLVAAQNGHTSCVTLLLSQGADVHQQLKDGATSLFLAAQSGHQHVLDALIRAGADVNQFKKDLTTPLYIASQMGHHKIVKRLISAGADVDAAREDGSTSLFKAAQKGHRLVIEALLVGGASTGLLGNGETALHMAALFGRTRISHMLLVNGANPLMKNKEGLSSCDLAKQAQYNDLLTVLESFEETCHLKNGRRPFTAPSSITVDLISDDSSQSTDTASTTDQTSGTMSTFPHASAPTPLCRNIPFSRLFPNFMPPGTEEELIAVLQSIAKPSIVQKDDLDNTLEHQTVIIEQNNNDHLKQPSLIENEYTINLEKLLATRHSNPEIREIEEFRKSFLFNSGNISSIDRGLVTNGDLDVDSCKPAKKTNYLNATTTPYRGMQSPQINVSSYIPPNHAPPPLPIPPQLGAANYNDKLFVLDQSTVLVGRRKMSQPNMKTYQYEK